MRTGEWEVASPEAVATPSRLAAARAEVWRFLPVWMFLFYGCLLLNTELTNLSPPRRDLAYTIVFPLTVFCGFYAVRALFARDVRERLAMLVITVGLALGLPTLNLLYHRPFVLQPDTLRLIYELSNFVLAAIIGLHAFSRERSHLPLFFGVGLLYGGLLENGGILLGFFHETHLELTAVPPMLAPIATVIGWCIVLYMGIFTVWSLREYVPALRRSALASAFLAAACSTLLDLQIDPLATASDCWVWDPLLPPWFHGVPLVNFVAWMCAIAPFAYVLFRYQEARGIHDGGRFSGRDLMKLTLGVPGILALSGVVFLVSIGLIEGVDGPSYEILFRFVHRLVG